MSGVPCNSEKDCSAYFDVLHMLLCLTTCASFGNFVLSFSFHYETITKAKFIFPQRRMAVELFRPFLSPFTQNWSPSFRFFGFFYSIIIRPIHTGV